MTDEILKAFSTPAIIAAIEDNMAEHFITFGRLPGAEAYDGPDMMWFVTGVPHSALNGVYRTRLSPEAVDARIGDTLRIFHERRVPVRWAVGPSARPADLGAHLEAHGVVHARDWVGMAADLQALNKATAPWAGLVIEEVGDLSGLKRWTRAFCLGYEFPDDVGDAFFEAFARAGFGPGRPLRHYLGSVDGEPMATTTVFFAAGVAGIYWVATAPQARRRGIGTALVTASLRDARAAGYRFSILHSTQMGERVYRQVGFQEICRLGLYAGPDRTDGGASS